MMHFTTKSDKSKGQFYAPVEGSMVMATMLRIKNVSNRASFYDPTSGSGSMLLKVHDETDDKESMCEQEKEVTIAGLAHMNMILHGSGMA